MTIRATQDQIAAATTYEELQVPSLFQRWAPRIVEAARVKSGDRVLDVACGTGVVAREAALRVGINGCVAGLDAGAGMLAVAQQVAPSIEWRLGKAESLPYGDATFDAVVSQFGLMFFENRILAIEEMLRVLVPGGRLAVAVWDSLENSQAYPNVVAVLTRLVGEEAADALKSPFSLGDKTELTALFEDAGAAGVEVTTHSGKAQFPTINAMVEADLRGWLPLMGVHLTEAQIEATLREIEQEISEYIAEDGRVIFEAPAHIVTAMKV